VVVSCSVIDRLLSRLPGWADDVILSFAANPESPPLLNILIPGIILSSCQLVSLHARFDLLPTLPSFINLGSRLDIGVCSRLAVGPILTPSCRSHGTSCLASRVCRLSMYFSGIFLTCRCEGSYNMHAEQPCIFPTMNRFISQ
jgi:hypothetical protein